jgi:UDP-glucuronate 4-epimerase
MQVLITGVAGFIGSNLAEHMLLKGHTVVGLDNFDAFYDRKLKEGNLTKARQHKNFSFYEADISNPDDLNKIDFKGDLVIHLAAKAGVRPSIQNPSAYIQNNIIGTQNVHQFMQARGIHKMVFASSSSIYGNNKKIPFSETDNVDHPISPYAFTKKACELMNFTFHELNKTDIINLRFFTVYGERQRPDLAIHKFVKAISNNEPIPLYGTGQTARDYTYVQDIVAGIEAAANYVMNNKNVYEIVNLGNSHPIKLTDLVKAIETILQKQAIINWQPMQPGDAEFTYADISKAQKLLNYHPSTPLEEGLKNFIAWYNEVKP